MDAHNLSWVLHIGDIFWRPCTDDHYRTALDRFNSLRHPVIYSPGDNEWTDCWEPGSGSFARASASPPCARSSSPTLVGASAAGAFRSRPNQTARIGEFVENARWSHAGVTFATVHLVGNGNGAQPFPARTAADDEEVRRRSEAGAAWLRETFAEAAAAVTPAVVIGFHGTLGFGLPMEHVGRRGDEPFAAALEEEVERFGKPVLAVHGDDHEFTVDHPLVRRTTGRWLANFTRLEVPGSPHVGWVRVVVTPGVAQPFAFQPLVVPRWKFW